jgi:hypothetical protein
MLLTEGFLGWGFFGIGQTSIRSTVVTGQTEGLKVGCGGMGGWRDGWVAKVDNGFVYEKWLQGRGIGLDSLIYTICIITMSGRGKHRVVKLMK